jgi:hypothetical protein
VKALGLCVIVGVLMSGPAAALGDLVRQPQPTMTERIPSALDGKRGTRRRDAG